MKKFHFNLQRILGLKIKQGELLIQEMQRLIMRENQHEGVKKYYEDILEEEYVKVRNVKKFTSVDYLQQQNFLFAIKNNIIRQSLLIKEYRLKIEQKRLEIVQNQKEVKTLEKLKEKQWEDYQYEEMQEERKQMDEISNRLFYTKV